MGPMQTTPHGWTIIDADAGVLSLTYHFSAEGTANCFTAKLPSGGLLIISPPPEVTPEQLEELAAYGEIEAIVANNGFHHMGLAAWRTLAPKATVYAAPGAATRIAKKTSTAGDLRPLSELQAKLGDHVAVVEAPSSKCGETWAHVKIDGGYAWYASDLLANLERLPSGFLFRWMFKLSGSGPGYRVFNLAVKLIIKDKNAALGTMLRDVRAHPPTVMVPAHGSVLTGRSVAADTEALLVAATS